MKKTRSENRMKKGGKEASKSRMRENIGMREGIREERKAKDDEGRMQGTR